MSHFLSQVKLSGLETFGSEDSSGPTASNTPQNTFKPLTNGYCTVSIKRAIDFKHNFIPGRTII